MTFFTLLAGVGIVIYLELSLIDPRSARRALQEFSGKRKTGIVRRVCCPVSCCLVPVLTLAFIVAFSSLSFQSVKTDLNVRQDTLPKNSFKSNTICGW